MNVKLSDSERDQAAHIVALFAMLIHAWKTNAFAEASRAQAELKRLGVTVRLPRRKSVKGVADAK